jgi:hypothetical protein
MMMNEQLTMFKCKSNWISHKNISYCASKLSTQKKLKQIKFQLKEIMIPWYCILFFLFGYIYWIPMFNLEYPMPLWKVLHMQLYLLKLPQQGCHLFQVVPMHFMGWAPPPMPKCQWCPTTCWRLNIPMRAIVPFTFIALVFETHFT